MADAKLTMLSKRVLCRFDSPEWLGEVLMDALGSTTPRSIVDLGSGGGALSLAAMSRWTSSDLVTVDVDATAGEEVRRTLSTRGSISHRHIITDLMQSLAETPVAALSGMVDLVVSNPPYRSAQWTPALAPILERAGLPRPAAICGAIPADLIFIAQALQLVRPGGKLGLILPDSMISGKAMKPFRQALVESHKVERVIQLPRRAFKKTDAQAYVVIIEHGQASRSVHLDRILTDGTWQSPLDINVNAASERMDYCFHEEQQVKRASSLQTIRELGGEARRGQLSSVQIAGYPYAAFHTTNFPKSPGSNVTLPSSPPLHDNLPGVWGVSGDILVARVDRKLEQKIAIVRSGAAILSDCILRLRCPAKVRERILAGLSSQNGQAQLIASSRGTGARHISVEALLNISV